MAIEWTKRLENQCSDLWRTGRSTEAVELVGGTKTAVYKRMTEMKVKSSFNPINNLKPRIRKFFANDVALMFELSASDLKSSLIGEYFNCSASTIRKAISNAKQHGFEKYPLRNK